MICKCGREAKYQLKNGSWWCEEKHQKCPANRAKYSNPGSKNGMFGKEAVFKGKNKHNYEPLKCISEKIKEQHKNGFKCYCLGYWKGKKHSEKTKEKIAIKMMGNNYGKGRGKITFYNGIKFKSTWEEKVAKYLDLNNIKWLYEEKIFILDDKTSYRPDFFIYENDKFLKIIEVKGYFRKENKRKFLDFKIKYPEINVELWDKNILKSKSII